MPLTEPSTIEAQAHRREVHAPATAVSTPTQASWKAFFLRYGITLGFLLVVVATLNYVVNPLGFYGTSVFPQLAWNGRGIKADLLVKMVPKPEALIFGSSRSWKIAPAQVQRLTGLRAFNLAVDGGMAEDDYLLLRTAVERAHVTPRIVIVGVDVETFHNSRNSNNIGVDYRVIQAREFGEYMPIRERITAKWIAFTRLFVLQQTELSWKSLKIAILRATGKRQRGKGAYDSDPDGLVHFNIFEAERSTGSYDLGKKIISDTPGYVKKFESYSNLSPERLMYFEKMLQLAHAQKAQVHVFLPPLHPRMEAALSRTPYEARRKEVIDALSRMCARNGAEFHDFSRVQNFGGDATWFFDGMHMNEQNSDLITSLLLSQRPNALQ